MCEIEVALRWVLEGEKGRRSDEEEGRECDNEDRPRLRPVGGEALWTEGLPFGLPTLPLLCLTSRSARAPKLNRRAKGVAGLLLVADVGGAKSSSNGLSSTEPELALEMLSVRVRGFVKGDVWPGEAASPMVVRDSRRLWALMAAEAIGPDDCEPACWPT
jgi:hypothetical protein